MSTELIYIAADTLNDLEAVRKATANRLRALRDDKGGTDVEVAQASRVLDLIGGAEKEATKALNAAMKMHPLHGFVKSTNGLGAKSIGRLLAAIGDPGDRETVSQLWAYCGMHVVGGEAPRRRRGQQSNWNAEARMRLFVIASNVVKTKGHGGPYGALYEWARHTKYGEAVHTQECKRCGPSGEPALVGSELNDGHKHARAMRLVSKAVLKDLWRVSHEMSPVYGGHHDPAGHGRSDTQSLGAGGVVGTTPDPLTTTDQLRGDTLTRFVGGGSSPLPNPAEDAATPIQVSRGGEGTTPTHSSKAVA